MLLSITSTTSPARDLGLLVRKHPDRHQTFELGFGNVHVVYPEASDDRCTITLLLDIDPVSLVRGRATAADSGGLVDAYVNDRAYAVSSFMSVAIARVLGSALTGKEAENVDASGPRTLSATVEPIRIGEDGLAARLFTPLGYQVDPLPYDVMAERHQQRYERLTISAETTLQMLLTHLYVLIPVLDDAKHYWVSDEELDKLFRFGGAWLTAHPERELITRRYLRRDPGLARAAVAKLRALDDDRPVSDDRPADDSEDIIERPIRLQDRRIGAVIEVLRASDARSIVDLGCGNGDLLAALVHEPQFDRIGGTDVSSRELERAKLRLDRLPMALSRRAQIELFTSSLVYTDRRLRDYDVAAMLEVIEHLDPHRLSSMERTLFAAARPRMVVITTPNAEYNALFPSLLESGGFRHPDHRFEWTRSQFEAWSTGVAERHGYAVAFAPVGDQNERLGSPTQMAVFRCN